MTWVRGHRRRNGLLRRSTWVRSHHRRRPRGVPIVPIVIAVIVVAVLIAVF
jgi:hypothetical protein